MVVCKDWTPGDSNSKLATLLASDATMKYYNPNKSIRNYASRSMGSKLDMLDEDCVQQIIEVVKEDTEVSCMGPDWYVNTVLFMVCVH